MGTLSHRRCARIVTRERTHHARRHAVGRGAWRVPARSRRVVPRGVRAHERGTQGTASWAASVQSGSPYILGITMVAFKILLAAAATATLAGQTLTPDNQRAEPFRVPDNVYYVGSSHTGSYRSTTPQGRGNIDGGEPEPAPRLDAHLAQLGLKIDHDRIHASEVTTALDP